MSPLTMTDESVTKSPPEDHRGSARELLEVAIPLMISSGSVSLMHVVDRIFLTWWSVDALAATLPAGITFWAAVSLPMGIGIYTNTFVAQYSGANRPGRLVASVWQGTYFVLFAGVLLLGLLPFTDDLFRWMGHESAVQVLEIEYFSVMIYGAAPMLLAAVLSSFFSGRGRTRVVMAVNLLVALVNIGLDYVMIFGVEGVIAPGGVRGAAIATVIAQAVAAAIFAGLVVKSCLEEGFPLWQSWRPDRDLIGRMLWYGMPNGFQFFVDIAGFAVFIALVGHLGKESLTATNLAFNLNSLAFIPMMGLSTAVMTLVGQRIGERDVELAVRTTWLAFYLSGLYMGAWGCVYLFAPDVILAPYAAFAEIESFERLRPIVTMLLRFIVLYSFFDAMLVVFGAAVRGAGDTRFSLVFSFICAWLLMVLPVYLLTRAGTLTLPIAWSVITVYIFVLGIGFLTRFQLGHWKSMSVIEHDRDEDPGEELTLPVTATTPADAAAAVSAAGGGHVE
ncbi:MAG: MATE family efflux transporter [Planctomycetaceae bacterium]|nr:MATE family efflux transporter [Planctomycetaceae bacterium]